MKFKISYRNLPISLRILIVFSFIISGLVTLQEFVNYQIGDFSYPFSWSSIIIRNITNYLSVVLLAPFMGYTAYAIANSKKWHQLLVPHILLSILIGFIHRIARVFFYNYFYSLFAAKKIQVTFYSGTLSPYLAGLISGILIYWLMVSFFITAINQKKLINKERELANAKVHALMAQLRPHFLYNTLNSISALIDFDGPGAQRIISRFADLLRAVLNKEATQFIMLREEMNFIQNYLSIEKERYRERLSIHYHIVPETKKAMVPTLILQPIVENAIKHGISKKMEYGTIEISSKLVSHKSSSTNKLLLEVKDNGKGLSDNLNYGIGLKNVTSRLKELYSTGYEFNLKNQPNGGCIVSMVIPLNINKE